MTESTEFIALNLTATEFKAKIIDFIKAGILKRNYSAKYCLHCQMTNVRFSKNTEPITPQIN